LHFCHHPHSVPTLVLHDKSGKEVGRLSRELEACQSSEEAAAVTEAFIAQQMGGS